MPSGLEIFRDHFKDYTDSCAIIGGTACMKFFELAGEDFRRTRDVDLVLVFDSEGLDRGFCERFWQFIGNGRYQSLKQGEKPHLYRFSRPAVAGYPELIEIFSPRPDSLGPAPDGGRIAKIPMDGDMSDLSAILLDDEAYSFVVSGKQVVDGLSVVSASHLIALKIIACSNLNALEVKHGRDKKNIRKHKADIVRLCDIVDPDASVELTDAIARQVRTFVDELLSSTGEDGRCGEAEIQVAGVLSRLFNLESLAGGASGRLV
ncbi:MAG: hypothetical protein K6C33_04195 [Desulfovibrio sp.]|nr:hypothetical protein [Desulfovibrio sp.]